MDKKRKIEKEEKKPSFSKRIKAELADLGFTQSKKTFKIGIDDKEKSKEERIEVILKSFSIHPKRGFRGKNPMIYLKDAGEIADVLKLLGAFNSLMEFENARILKEVSENVNRRVNFEAANINRTVKASVRQQEDILLIKEMIGLERIESGLRELAEQRLQYPDASLEELSRGLSTPIGKSGVNHRLRKLARIARELREEMARTGMRQK